MTINRLRRRGSRLLTKGSRFFKTDLFYLTKGGFWVSLSQVVMIASGFVLSIGFANWLPAEVYGNYRFVLALTGIITSLSLSGMGTAIIRATARGFEGALSTGFKTYLKWSFGMTLAGFAGAAYYFINGNETLALSLLIVGSLLPFLESARLYSAYLTGKKEFRRNTILGFFRRVVPIGVVLGTITLTESVVVIIFAYFASSTVTMLSIYFSARKEFRFAEAATDESSAERLISDSKHFSVMRTFNTIAGQLDKILIFHFLGAAPLAVYSFATMPVTQLRRLSGIVRTLLIPKLATRTVSELKKSIPRKMLIFLPFVIVIVALYIPTAPLIYKFFFPQYVDSILLSQVFSLSLFVIPFMLMGETFRAHMKKRELYYIQTVVPVTRILFLVIFIPLYGLWGVVVAILLTLIVASVMELYFFFRL